MIRCFAFLCACLLSLVSISSTGLTAPIEDVTFTIAGRAFAFRAGETIHTENSHKYGLRDSRLLLRAAGWAVVREWTDSADQFALILAEAEPPRFAP